LFGKAINLGGLGATPPGCYQNCNPKAVADTKNDSIYFIPLPDAVQIRSNPFGKVIANN